jgi:hypothetical protein
MCFKLTKKFNRDSIIGNNKIHVCHQKHLLYLILCNILHNSVYYYNFTFHHKGYVHITSYARLLAVPSYTRLLHFKQRQSELLSCSISLSVQFDLNL